MNAKGKGIPTKLIVNFAKISFFEIDIEACSGPNSIWEISIWRPQV